MRRFLVGFLAVIGFLTLLVMIGVGVLITVLATGPDHPPPPDRIVLHLDLRRAVPDMRREGLLGFAMAGSAPTLHELVDTIDRARGDDRVVGMVAEFGGDSFGLATAQEIGDAVQRFRTSGRFTLATADSFGEFGPSNAAYWLASRFEQVWLAPIGTLGLTGVRAEVPFAHDGLARLGVEPEFVRRGPYKSFTESLTERDFTPPHREMVESLVDDLFGQLVNGIAQHRGLDPVAVRILIDRAPLLGPEALEARLVDRLATAQEVEGLIRDRFGERAALVDTLDYRDIAPPPPAPAAQVALIQASGTITLGDDDGGSVFGGEIMSAYAIARAIDQAVEDDSIAAIVLRIDSGGGSAVGSDVIGRSVRRAAERRRPLIVSMGAAAASGGYWIAADAAAIVAQPATLTGSIGVFAGKLELSGLWRQVGIAWGAVQRGGNADLWSGNAPYSDNGRARVEAVVDSLYGRFLDHVAQGRHMDRSAVEAIAGGRVWTGAQAQQRGLVDRLGGLDTALAVAREAAHLPPDAPLELVPLPRPRSPLHELVRLLGGGAAAADGMAAAWRRLEPAARVLAPLAETPGSRTLRMPPTGLDR